MKHGDMTETLVASQTVFEGRLLRVKCDMVSLHDGKPATREYVEHNGAVMIVPLLDSGELVMERQYRYVLGRHCLEFPAGKIDPGEEPLATGRRELLEETGYVAREWIYLTTIHPTVAYSTERILVYLARGLEHRGSKLDEGEFLEVLTLSPAALLELVRSGEISDVKTVIGAFWLEKLLRGDWRAGPALA
ncbi:MAG: NUDIX hydrolase [Betaproteobacteria bacterium]|nr:MAG: NUDIX hydrolase [Betaproteobacteria bacterium]